MDWVMTFLTDNVLLLVLAFVVILMVIFVIKTIVRWIITLAIVVVIAIWGYSYMPDDLANKANQVQTKLTESIANEYINGILSATKVDVSKRDANTYVANIKGYAQGIDFILTGTFGSTNAVLYVGDEKLNVTLPSNVLKFLKEKAK